MLTGLEGGGRMATVGHKTQGIAAAALRPTGLSTETWGREAAGAAAMHHQEAESVVRLRHAARGVKRELVRGTWHEFIETTPCV